MIAAVALTVLVYERTHSPFLASLTFALGFLPALYVLFVRRLVDEPPLAGGRATTARHRQAPSRDGRDGKYA